jgi:hypothetical protein
VVEAKVRAIDAMRSQQYGGNYARKRIELTDGSIGAIVGVAYAEGYITYLPEVARLLPVSDRLRKYASESEADTMARFTEIIATTVELPD